MGRLVAALIVLCLSIHANGETARKLRFMPLGDSITDYGCWRPHLGRKLNESSLDVDFVGSVRSRETCGNVDYDRDHEGHPGYQAVRIANEKLLPIWLDQNPADIITMHLGTIDIVQAKRSPEPILTALSTLIDQMREKNPKIRIIVAQIIPIAFAADAVIALNAKIPAWAASKNSTTSPIWVVDQWTDFSASVDLYDGLHPSESGDVKIAERFLPVMVRAIMSLQ